MKKKRKGDKRTGHTGANDKASSPDHAPGKPPVLIVKCAARVKVKPLRWLVPGMLPQGKLVLLAGDGGLGKSSISLDLAACLSRGECAFGRRYPPLAADSLIVSCEDDPADTINPRLLAAGADLRRIQFLEGVGTEDGRPAPWSLAHHAALDAHLAAHPQIRLVIIDPASAFAGLAGIDGHKDAELRGLLGPLTEVAARHAVTVLLVCHLGKGETSKTARRVLGSVAWVNAVRAAWVVAEREEDEGKRLLLPFKANLAPRSFGLMYQLVPLSLAEQDAALASCTDLEPDDRDRLKQQLFRVEWLGETDIEADEVFTSTARQAGQSSDIKAAAEWLADRLQDGPVSSAVCVSEGNEALGLDRPERWWRVTILKKKLRGKVQKAGFKEGWVYRLESSSSSSSSSSEYEGKRNGPPGAPERETMQNPSKNHEDDEDDRHVPGWTAPDACPDVLNTPFETPRD